MVEDGYERLSIREPPYFQCVSHPPPDIICIVSEETPTGVTVPSIWTLAYLVTENFPPFFSPLIS